MRISSTLLFTVLIATLSYSNKAYGQFQYISPMPGSLYHNPGTNIILKNGNLIDEKSLNPSLVSIEGSASGVHSSRIILSDDGKTIVIYPVLKFAEGEKVMVSVADGFRRRDGGLIQGTSFDFHIHPVRTAADWKRISDARQYLKEQELREAGISYLPKDGGTRDSCQIPEDTITITGNEYTGDLFYYNFHAAMVACLAKTILTNTGDSIFVSQDNEKGMSFTINKNGYLSYYSYVDSGYEMMDSSYNVVKLFLMGNGYRADEHEFLVYPNGHSFMLCYDAQPGIDLTSIGGLDSVTVIGSVLQELDENQNVIFQWRSWDHFQYTDAAAWVPYAGLLLFDWVHSNSMDLDDDANLLVSSRNLGEITKINLSTGDIMWRMGGENNEFTFVNDTAAYLAADTGQTTPLYFTGQHDFKRLLNGHFTMFNNSNNLALPLQAVRSSAKEYELDQVNKVATLVWSYKHPPVGSVAVFAPAMGSVQRLPNGNTLIDWGLISSSFPQVPRFTEVDSAGNIVWEFNFKGSDYYVSYRAYKFDWNRCAPTPDSSFVVTFISADSAVLTWATPNFSEGYIFEYKLSTETAWIQVPLVTNTVSLGNLQPNSVYDYRIQSVCTAINDSSAYSGTEQFNTLPVGIFSVGEDPSLHIYPNPAKDILNISFEMKKNIPVTLTLVNLVGDKTCEESWTGFSGKNLKNLSIDKLPAGVYLLELKCDDFSVRRQIEVR